MWASDSQLLTISRVCGQLELRLQEPLSRHTSFRTGGPAAVMAFPKTVQELQQLLRSAADAGVEPYLLGAGTNILAPDEGLHALVICTKDALGGIRLTGETQMEVFSGESLARTAVFARQHALTGLEFAHGIPGTLGGGVYMNAGAYGGELRQVVQSVTVLTLSGELLQFTAADCAFGYRSSVFQQTPCVIVSAQLQLQKGDPAAIGETMRTLMEKRKASQPLELPSAGSTFKRPEGYFAGPLIEQAGLKGEGFGGAQVSRKHAGFIVNTGGATTADILKTIELVQTRVRQLSGVSLEPEVRIW